MSQAAEIVSTTRASHIAGSSRLMISRSIVTPRRAAISAHARRGGGPIPLRAVDVADIRFEIHLLGMPLMARGKISQTRSIHASIELIPRPADSIPSAISAAAKNASCRSGIITAPVCRPDLCLDPQTRGSGERGDHAQRQLAPFKQRALLDMQFNERIVVTGG